MNLSILFFTLIESFSLSIQASPSTGRPCTRHTTRLLNLHSVRFAFFATSYIHPTESHKLTKAEREREIDRGATHLTSSLDVCVHSRQIRNVQAREARFRYRMIDRKIDAGYSRNFRKILLVFLSFFLLEDYRLSLLLLLLLLLVLFLDVALRRLPLPRRIIDSIVAVALSQRLTMLIQIVRLVDIDPESMILNQGNNKQNTRSLCVYI